MNYLNLYKECMETGVLPGQNGLCYVFEIDRKMLRLFIPTEIERRRLAQDGLSHVYWASGCKANREGNSHNFTPLRQTIVLLMAAINDEL